MVPWMYPRTGMAPRATAMGALEQDQHRKHKLSVFFEPSFEATKRRVESNCIGGRKPTRSSLEQ